MLTLHQTQHTGVLHVADTVTDADWGVDVVGAAGTGLQPATG